MNSGHLICSSMLRHVYHSTAVLAYFSNRFSKQYTVSQKMIGMFHNADRRPHIPPRVMLIMISRPGIE